MLYRGTVVNKPFARQAVTSRVPDQTEYRQYRRPLVTANLSSGALPVARKSGIQKRGHTHHSLGRKPSDGLTGNDR